MFVSVVISFLFAAFLLFRYLRCIRDSIVGALLVHFLFVLVLSEILSLAGAFDAASIRVGWLVLALFWTVVGLGIKGKRTLLGLIADQAKAFYGQLDGLTYFLLCVMSFLFLVTLLLVIMVTPNNWDSLTYHLPRIVFWLQNGSLNHFPTDDYRMLYNPALAELVQCHLHIMSGGMNYGFNIAQWLSFGGLCLVGSRIAAMFGARPSRQVGMALITVSLPVFVLQAVTTQNDLMMMFLLSAALLFFMKYSRSSTSRDLVSGIIAAGLAMSCKATAMMFLPFLLLFPVVKMLKNRRYLAVAAVALALLPSTGWLARNMSFFGHPLGYHDDTAMEDKVSYYSNRFSHPVQVPGTVLRNLSLFLATPLDSVNKKTERCVRAFHSLIGDTADNPELMWYDTKYHVPLSAPHEDAPPTLWYFLLALLLVGLCTGKAVRGRRIIESDWFMVLSIAGLLATSAYIKWMPWNARFMGCWLVFIIWFGASALSDRYVKILALFFSVLVIPFCMISMARSLIPVSINVNGAGLEFASVWERDKARSYFALQPWKGECLSELVELAAVQAPAVVGIARRGIDPPVYPLMDLMRDHEGDVRFVYIEPQPGSVGLGPVTYPELAIVVGAGNAEPPRGYEITYSNEFGFLCRRFDK